MIGLFISVAVMVSLVPVFFFRLWVVVPGREYKAALQQTTRYQKESAKKAIEERERKELRERRIEIAKLSRPLRRKIIDSYSELGVRYFPRSWERKGRERYKKVEIKHTIIGDDYVVFRVDKLPDKTRPGDILKEEMLSDLRLKVGRPDMTMEPTDYDGIFIKVPLKGSSAGIPNLYHWKKSGSTVTAIEQLPKGNNYLPVGIGLNRKFYYIDLRKQPHVLVAGSTGGGKSNILNCLICSLLVNNTPEDLRIAMIDMKRVELFPYRRVPHLWKPIVTDYERVEPLLIDVRTEMENRYSLLSEHDLRNASSWNEKFPDRFMPRLVVVFDEMADVMLDRKFGGEITAILERLAAMTRAVDINFVFCTQRPSVKIITGLIKANVTTRIAFNCASNTDSMVIIDRGDAYGLSPVGRAVYQESGHLWQVQTPWIQDDQITATIAAVVADENNQPEITESRLLTVMAHESYETPQELWKRIKHERGATPEFLHHTLSKWQYIPELQKPVVTMPDGKEFLLWNWKLLERPPDYLPDTAEEMHILQELG